MGQTRKMRFLLASALFAAVSALPAAQDDCKPVTVQPNFNLTKFVGGVGGVGKWYIHKEMTIKYLPANERYCVVASYTQKDATHVKVHNYANLNHTNGPVDDSDVHVKSLGGICGISKDKTTEAKLEVGPCYLSFSPGLPLGPTGSSQLGASTVSVLTARSPRLTSGRSSPVASQLTRRRRGAPLAQVSTTAVFGSSRKATSATRPSLLGSKIWQRPRDTTLLSLSMSSRRAASTCPGLPPRTKLREVPPPNQAT